MNDSPSNFRKKIHVPMTDIDDIPFNKQDPKFVAQMTNMMQVPQSITLTNGHSNSNQSSRSQSFYSNPTENIHFQMDIPDKLTVNQADEILTTRESQYSSTNSLSTNNNESNYNLKDGQQPTVTPPSTPTKVQYTEDDIFTGRTPAISADLFQRMRPRRSSIEIDLHSEIRNLRDRVNSLEHESQVNSTSCKFFYAIICSYCLMKTFSWLVKSK